MRVLTIKNSKIVEGWFFEGMLYLWEQPGMGLKLKEDKTGGADET